MLTVLAIACLLFGGAGVLMQAISIANWPLAQELGFQEPQDETDTLYRRLELNTAIWDMAVLWTLPAAGALMLAEISWWPYLALVAAGAHIDTAGRELAKTWGLRAEGVRTGGEAAGRVALIAFGIMFALAAALLVAALVTLRP